MPAFKLLGVFITTAMVMSMLMELSDGAVVSNSNDKDKYTERWMDHHVLGVMGSSASAVEAARKAAKKKKREEQERSSVTTKGVRSRKAGQFHQSTEAMS